MSFWIRPATLFPRFVEECLRDFRHMERMMFTPLYRAIPYEIVDRSSGEVVNNESKFAVSVDVSKFKPENLKVNIDGHRVTIEGKEELKEENGYSMKLVAADFLRVETGTNNQPYIQVVNNESKFAVSVDVSKFKPENLKVNIDGHRVTIEGKEELKEENGYSMKSFVRQFVLPDDVNLDAIRSSLTDSGQLSVEAPKLAKPSDSGGRSIPIENVGVKS
ncbi:Hsp20/alpha crystallin family protein [Dictyocaulus viviparus]|uniref:Hsp20/alpha crystallin family protein n=1 Tax=Dictyocaulus viviparus TaxID=29172 RepID=A0A0D8XX55_DICVI|nr:Hsp20/alpha crystallin family protein [Dictyocaulus viviparus]